MWGAPWGATDDVGPLKVVLVRRPGPEFEAMTNGHYDPELGQLVDPDGRWYWSGAEPPDVARVHEQHNGLVAALRAEGVEVVFAEELAPPLYNGVFMRDPLVTVRGGAVIGRLAARDHVGLEPAHARPARAPRHRGGDHRVRRGAEVQRRGALLDDGAAQRGARPAVGEGVAHPLGCSRPVALGRSGGFGRSFGSRRPVAVGRQV